jgi:hypothetical protein
MPTQEIPDNELDNFFRKAAGEFSPEFEPEAWKQMEKMLDDHDGGAGAFWWKKILLSVAILLVASLGGLLFVKLARPDGQAGKPELSAAAQKYPRLAAGKRDPKEESRSNASVTGTAAQPGRSTPGTPDNASGEAFALRPDGSEPDKENGEKTARKPAESEERGNGRITSDGTEGGKENRTSNSGKRIALRRSAVNRRTSVEKEENSENKVPSRNRGTGRMPKGLRTAPLDLQDSEATAENGSFPAIPGPLAARGIVAGEITLSRQTVPPPVVESQPEIEPKTRQESNFARFSIGAMLSPDLSSVGFFNRLTPGTNTGLQLEYRLSNRFRVGVGAIYSVKLYSATVENYTVPQGFWTYGVKPSGIDANCKILDLPVHLRFDAVQRGRYSLFLSTGLSSYIMLSEKYNYSYDSYAPYLKPSWSGRSTGEHYFSVANLSAGYERNMGRSLSLQVEPFLKLPLGGVGFGKVKLISSGVFLSVKYRFTRNR